MIREKVTVEQITVESYNEVPKLLARIWIFSFKKHWIATLIVTGWLTLGGLIGAYWYFFIYEDTKPVIEQIIPEKIEKIQPE